MKEAAHMIVVLVIICTVCGVALSGFREMTAERIENQVLMNVQGPRVNKVLEGSQNDLIADRKVIKIDGQEVLLFMGKKDGKPWAIAYETLGKGFGGDLKVMVGYDIENDKLTGIQIVSHKETPGVGSKVTEDQFTQRFKGIEIDLKAEPEKRLSKKIDAISGATYSSQGVYEAIGKSLQLYMAIKKQDLSTK
ncbi:MAG: RnfABCDGE type electron transport complex subunit G [Desulfobacteraceae bacterium]|nr:RnfABCDGE type electron transport complex subunit G [Desulfobacteraceae bacterium]